LRLCLELGIPSISELLQRVSSAEITEWMAFEKINGPLGGRRTDYAAALITKAIYDVNTKKRKRRKLGDFLLKWGGKRRRPRTGAEMSQRVLAAFGFTSDTDERR
jgi:hypothetical protein